MLIWLRLKGALRSMSVENLSTGIETSASGESLNSGEPAVHPAARHRPDIPGIVPVLYCYTGHYIPDMYLYRVLPPLLPPLLLLCVAILLLLLQQLLLFVIVWRMAKMVAG